MIVLLYLLQINLINQIGNMFIPTEVIHQRNNRHNKLMKMIHNYHPSQEQRNKLEKIKNQTMMEINVRYLRSQPNRSYKFPKNYSLQDNDEEEELEYELSFGPNNKNKKGAVFYDLTQQNQVYKKSYINSQTLSLQNSRRVHSLGNQRSQEKDQLIRRHLKQPKAIKIKQIPLIQNSGSTKSLRVSKTRKNSIAKDHTNSQNRISQSYSSKNLLLQSHKLKLPQIKNSNIGSNSTNKLKTEPRQEEQIELAIGKKLVTEISTEQKFKNRGIQKYLREMQYQKMSKESKRNVNSNVNSINLNIHAFSKKIIIGQSSK